MKIESLILLFRLMLCPSKPESKNKMCEFSMIVIRQTG